MGGSGLWPYGLEHHDMASALKHATTFGGMATILELSDAAWVWAAALGKETTAS